MTSRYAGALWVMAFGMALLTPQQIGRQSTDPTIRVTVDLVPLDAAKKSSAVRLINTSAIA